MLVPIRRKQCSSTWRLAKMSICVRTAPPIVVLSTYSTTLRFLYGLNSRSSLWVTYDMVSFALTYHQVQPWFLDFLFPFGKQDIPRDFRFSSFKRVAHQSKTPGVWDVPQLGRSGQGYHICYNMKSVERKSSNAHMPWSLEQTVVYHSYDTLTGQAFWIILKGNDSIRNDLEQSVRRRKQKGEDRYSTLIDSFNATIQVHLEVCDWSRQGWRWYINDLETRLDQLTEHGVTNDIFASKDPLRSFPSTIDANGHIQDPKVLGFSNLQQAQHVEETASKALLTLKSDVSNILALKAHYLSVGAMQGNDWMATTCLSNFETELDAISAEFAMHQAALEALVRLVAGRKETVSISMIDRLGFLLTIVSSLGFSSMKTCWQLVRSPSKPRFQRRRWRSSPRKRRRRQCL